MPKILQDNLASYKTVLYTWLMDKEDTKNSEAKMFYIYVKYTGQRKALALDLDNGQVGGLKYATAFTSREAAEDKVKMLKAVDKKAEFKVMSDDDISDLDGRRTEREERRSGA